MPSLLATAGAETYHRVLAKKLKQLLRKCNRKLPTITAGLFADTDHAG